MRMGLMQRWEDLWIDNVSEWELELLGTPGLFGAMCQMDSLDVLGAEEFLVWYRKEIDQ